MVSLALAGEDVGAIESALVGFDATIAEGRAWVASDTHDPATGKAIREKLEAEANELRPLTRKLEIAYGESMSTKKHVGLEAVEAARAHMEAQRAVRREVGALIDGTLALGEAATAPERWVDVEGQYV
ncbi:MAG: hypothetical protein KC656_33915, partial [Myxococcales bacterium]|nr:hypothetical protein [Myxococcales bacterium]